MKKFNGHSRLAILKQGPRNGHSKMASLEWPFENDVPSNVYSTMTSSKSGPAGAETPFSTPSAMPFSLTSCLLSAQTTRKNIKKGVLSSGGVTFLSAQTTRKKH